MRRNKSAKIKLMAAFILTAVIVATLSADDAPAGLLGHWPFDEGRGQITRDTAGGIGDATLIGNPEWGKTPAGYCLFFNGTPEHKVYAEISGRGFRGQTRHGTFSVWAKAVDGGVVYASDAAGRARLCSLAGLQLGIRGGQWIAVVYDGYVQYIEGPPVTDGEWIHLALTWDDVFTRLYANGAEVVIEGGTYLTRGFVGHDVRTPFYIASTNPQWGQMFRGYLDELKFFNRALAPAEIAAEYEQGCRRMK